MSYYEMKGKYPSDWKTFKISDIGLVVGGGTPSTKIKNYYGEEIPWITPKDLSNYDRVFIEKGQRSITKEGLANSSTRLVPKGTVLFTSRAPIGYVAIAKNEISTNQGFKSIVCNSKAHNKFIYYWLKHSKRKIESIASGSTFKEISGNSLKNIEITLPSYEEQKAIAEILFSFDSKIILNQQINEILETIIQTIFKQWFVNFEFPNEEDDPYKSSGGEMIYNDELITHIPQGWKVEKIGNVLKVQTGGTPSRKNDDYWKNGKIPWIGSSKTKEFRIISSDERISEKAITNSSTVEIPKRTTVLAIIGNTIGKVSLTEINCCINQNIAAIIGTNHLPSEYVYPWIKNRIFDIISWKSGGAQASLNQNSINQSIILVPDETIIKKYFIIVKPLFDIISSYCFMILNLSKIRDLLLPKLMSGELRVPVEVRK